MKKALIILSIIIFILVTVFVLTSTSTNQIKRVSVANQNVIFNQNAPEITSRNVNVNTSNSKIRNQTYTANESKIRLETTTYPQAKTETYTYNSNYETDKKLSEYNTNVNRIKNIEKAIRSNKENASNNYNSNSDSEDTHRRYGYENIDWSIWKSNFVNQILDDSMNITSLNNYGAGSWFYYSFIVTSSGEIKDITINSFHLNDMDKERVRNLIRQYAYQPITTFPRNSKRKTAKIKAVMMLGYDESRAKPSDFNDTERIRMQY